MKISGVLLLVFGLFVAMKVGSPTNQIPIPEFPLDFKTNKVSYMNTVGQKDSAHVLFFKSFTWLANNFEEPFEVMKEQDQKLGLLTGTGTFEVQYTDEETGKQHEPETILYDFRIDSEFGKFHYLFTNIRIKDEAYYGIENWIKSNETQYDSRTRSYLVQIHGHMQEVVGLLRSEMAMEQEEEEEFVEEGMEEVESGSENEGEVVEEEVEEAEEPE